MVLCTYAQTNIVAVHIEGVAAVQHSISSPSDVSGYLTVLPKCMILSRHSGFLAHIIILCISLYGFSDSLSEE